MTQFTYAELRGAVSIAPTSHRRGEDLQDGARLTGADAYGVLHQELKPAQIVRGAGC